MALKITGIPDCKAVLGFSQFAKAAQLNPGVSDYPTGGYPITNATLGTGPLYGAWKISANGAASLYDVNFVLPTYGVPPATTDAQAQLNMIVTSAGVQVAANTDLSACAWIAEFLAEGE